MSRSSNGAASGRRDRSIQAGFRRLDRRAASIAEALTALAVAAALLVGCGGASDPPSGSDRPLTIGFLYVGSVEDAGYNQAAYEGSLELATRFPQARLIQRENVPETPRAEEVMERMIDHGATIIFPTSFGHLPAALAVAARHPEVTFFHQGGLETADNLGTYFGTIWQAEYAAGQAAGYLSESDRLGFVAAFPIAQSLLTINAFELGAQSVNPDAETEVVFTGNWCEPSKQRRATRGLIARGADVIAQHEDCTKPVIETAAAEGAKVIGYHYDARDVASGAWITGPVWDWGPLMSGMVGAVLDGRFDGSVYDGRLRVGIEDGAVGLARFGRAVPPTVAADIGRTMSAIGSGKLAVFDGPIRDQDGILRIRGDEPPVTELEEVDYLVDGVIGDLDAP